MIQPKRCTWAENGTPLDRDYHDHEWGVAVRDDRQLFECLTLEGAQAGLSWSIILRKREGYRAAFAGFAPEVVARFTARRIERLVTDPGIVRHRGKIESVVDNARALLAIVEECGSFSGYLWSHVDGRPIVNRWRRQADVPASTPLSEQLSRDLRRRGFRFVGPTTCYAFMQATGMVVDHLVTCFRHPDQSSGSSSLR
ncbi:MAG: DNA-3-methyladenine glycosylase I [Gammaproteobacteria bacterium]|jgi:DNA-3-methyladenine glycosylase I